MNALGTAEYADALGRRITYVDMPFAQWRDQELGKRGLSEHLFEHFLTMARLHAANRYDRLTDDVEAITGRPATSVRDFVARHKALFDKRTIRQGSSAPAASWPSLSRGPRI
jgi:NAD(P)H dehydrogenase (quinone)